MRNRCAGKRLVALNTTFSRRAMTLWVSVIVALVAFCVSNAFQLQFANAAPPLAFGFPADTHNISDDWAAHRARGSLGGTDYTASYGSNLYAMADGIVAIADSSTSGSGGRYIRVNHGAMGPYGSVQTDSLHLSAIYVSVGDVVVRGQVIGKTGASAYGSDYGTGGPHVHVHGWFDGTRSDLEPHIGSLSPTTGGIIYQITASAASGWVSGNTGLAINSDSFSALSMNGRWPQVMVNMNNTLYQVWGDTSGWHLGNTGLNIGSGKISAVNMGGAWPQVMVNISGTLYQVWGDTAGWHIGNTGLDIGSGQISAVNMGGGWPQVMVNINGTLYQVWGDTSGWHLGNTGLDIGSGQISAVNMGGRWPQVMVNINGTLYQVWGDASGWHLGNTGLYIGLGQISAVNMGGRWPQVMVNMAGNLYQIWGDTTGWHLGNTGLGIGSGKISAVNMGGGWPQAISVH